MSLAIDVDQVTAVLLADGWHDMHDHPLVFCTRAAVPFALNRGAR